MDSYYTLITAKGRPKLAAALLPDGQPLDLSFLAIGDGGGAAVTPVDNREALVNEVYRQPVNSVDADPENPGWIIVRSVLPPEVGGWTAREVAIYDAAGDMVAYGNFPTSYKPALAEGSGKELIVDIYLEVGAGANVTLQINPSAVTATKAWVLQQIQALQAADGPLQNVVELVIRSQRAKRYFLSNK